MTLLDKISTWSADNLGITPAYQHKLLLSVLIIAVLWLLRMLVLRYGLSRIQNVQARYRFKKSWLYITYVTGGLLLVPVWLQGFSSITTYLGLFSAGLAIALKEPIANLAGWLFIIIRHPFDVGDRIEINTRAGDVIDLRMFQFTILEISDRNGGEQSTGRIIHLPNSMVFIYPLANYSKGFQYLWNEVCVTITFESNWKEAKKLLQQIADRLSAHHSEQAAERVREASRKFMIFYGKLTPIVYTRVVDHGIELTVRYLCEPRRRRNSAEQLWEAVLDEFATRPDIDFAYPTRRVYTLEPAEPRDNPSGP